MWDVFEEMHFMVERNMIKEHQMLMNLAHVSDMRHDRQLELSCHQTNGQKFTNTGEPRAICLNKVQASVEQIILEHDPVRDVFSSSNTDRCDGASKFYVSVNIIGMSWLFNPERFQ